MIPVRTIAGTVDIGSGTLLVNTMPPIYQDDTVQVSLGFVSDGSEYEPAADVSVFLYYVGDEDKSENTSMAIDGSAGTATIDGSITSKAGLCRLCIMLTDGDDQMIAASAPIVIIRARVR